MRIAPALGLAAALMATSAPVQSFGAEPVRYTMTAFTNASQSNMSVYDSADGTRFTLKKPLAYTPPEGLIRDPSVMKHTDGWYYVAYTTGWTGDTIGLAQTLLVGSVLSCLSAGWLIGSPLWGFDRAGAEPVDAGARAA